MAEDVQDKELERNLKVDELMAEGGENVTHEADEDQAVREGMVFQAVEGPDRAVRVIDPAPKKGKVLVEDTVTREAVLMAAKDFESGWRRSF